MVMLLLATLFAQATGYPRPLAPADQKIIASHVGLKLKDGDSAKYRWPKQLSDVSYCGWVNAKNSYGAYAGFEQFYVLGAQGLKGRFVVISVDLASEDRAGVATVRKMCSEAGYDTRNPPLE